MNNNAAISERIRTLEIGDIIRIHEYSSPKEQQVLTYVGFVKHITYFNNVWELYIESFDKTLACLLHIATDKNIWCCIKQIDILQEAQTHAEIL